MSSEKRQRLLAMFESQLFSMFSRMVVNGFTETEILMQQPSFLTCISAEFLSLAAKITLIPEKDHSDGPATLSEAGVCSSLRLLTAH